MAQVCIHIWHKLASSVQVRGWRESDACTHTNILLIHGRKVVAAENQMYTRTRKTFVCIRSHTQSQNLCTSGGGARAHTHSLAHPHTHTLSLSLSLSHTHTHTHTHTLPRHYASVVGACDASATHMADSLYDDGEV